MVTPLSEDIRKILNKLNEYITDISEETKDDNSGDKSPRDEPETIDDMLTSPRDDQDEVSEDLSDTKIKSYMDKDKSGSTKTDSVTQMKSMIDAVKNHGTPQEKKDLGINEYIQGGQAVDVIFYNSGYGEKLDSVAGDPKRKRQVNGVLQMNTSTGAPQLKFNEKGDSTVYYAEWNPKYGWVADLD